MRAKRSEAPRPLGRAGEHDRISGGLTPGKRTLVEGLNFGPPQRNAASAPLVRRLRRASTPLSDRPTTLTLVLPFDHLFPELAIREVLMIEDASTRPSRILVFREFYCTDPRCDCRRVVLHATVDGRPRVIASIGYGFEPPLPPFEDEPQALLDPLNPQSEMSETVLDLFTTLVEREPAIRERLISHYVRWKNVVDDPRYPDHRKVRSAYHDDSTFSPVYPPRDEGFPANQRCFCRSGKKYKNCCGRAAAAAAGSTRPQG